MQQHKAELIATVKKLTQPGKGILAADESVSTLKTKFDKISLETSDENRRAYRELLITTPDLEKYISGIILFQETVDQKTPNGINFIEILNKKGIVPGIKLDKGLIPLIQDGKENFTRGMDDLHDRAKEFYAKGCRFAKWRCALRNDGEHPSPLAVHETAWSLARYAYTCQVNGLVPIVEPEMLTDGKWDLKDGISTSTKIFAKVFEAMHQYGVIFEGCLFKPHMITAGSEFQPATAQEIAKATVDVLRSTCPAAMGGIFFLSGGQSEKDATNNLNEINKYAMSVGRPWHLSFSYGRALQTSVVNAWKGKKENLQAAQEVLLKRAEHNYNAVLGKYDEKADTHSSDSNFQKDYSY